MIHFNRLKKLLLLCCILLIPARCLAAANLEIWPVTVSLSGNRKDSDFWLRNIGQNSVALQIRVVRWTQEKLQNVYSEQNDVYALPTFINLEAGQEMPIRIFDGGKNHIGESSYRIVIDQLPQPEIDKEAQEKNGITIQMQYLLPLFIYGSKVSNKILPDINGLPREKHSIIWWLSKNELWINNKSQTHIKLNSIAFQCRGGICSRQSIPVSYVLPGATMALPLSLLTNESKASKTLIINPKNYGEEHFNKD